MRRDMPLYLPNCTYGALTGSTAYMRKKLSNADVLAAEGKTRPYETHDAGQPGLILRVQPSGVKSFVVQYGRGKRVTLDRRPPELTVSAARAKAIEIRADADRNGTPAAARSKLRPEKFKDFIDKHYAPWVEQEQKSGKATVQNLRAQFGELFDSKPMPAISAAAVDKFKAKRLAAGISPVTVNRDLDRLRAALNKAVEWNLVASNPLNSIKRAKVEEEPRVRHLTKDEEVRLREALARREAKRREQRVSGNAHSAARGREQRPLWSDDQYTDHVAPLVLLAINTGLRRGELLGLSWESIDLPGRRLKVRSSTAKSGKVRHVQLNSEAFAVVERLHRYSTRSGLVFHGRDGNAMTHVKSSWASLMADADLVDFHFHDCRHHFASKLVMAGVILPTNGGHLARRLHRLER